MPMIPYEPRGSRGLLTIHPLSEEAATKHPQWVPTDAVPGSSEKMAVIQHRILHGLPIFHPEDRGTCDIGKPLDESTL